MKQNESVKKLEVGRDYVNSYNSIIVIDRVGDFDNIGFYGKTYYNNLACHNPAEWREATEEEVIEAFKRHLIHRYGEDWETMKIKERHPDSVLDVNNGAWEVEISTDADGWNVYNKNGLLYCNGIWVKGLEEPTKSTDWTPAPEDIEAMNKKEKASKTQIGGSHYSDMAIQPIEYIMANKLSFPAGNVVKYVSRYDKKNNSIDLQIQDLEKAKQNIDFIIEELRQ